MIKKAGFSLLELSIVIVIFAVLTTVGVSIFTVIKKQDAYKVTERHLDRVEQALQQFLRDNKRLPCPALISAASSSVTYGDEIRTNACATSYYCSTTAASDDANVIIGTVPTATLNIPAETMLDGWGNKFIYVADRRFGQENCSDATKVNADFYTNEPTITVTDDDGTKTSAAIYALISNGENKAAAYNKDGKAEATADAGDEAENTDGDKTFVENTLGKAGFDDITRYKTKIQLILDSAHRTPLAGNECSCTTDLCANDLLSLIEKLCFGK
jgi:prepilin-type N-terminal cleavage/methylation domain-containing protein